MVNTPIILRAQRGVGVRIVSVGLLVGALAVGGALSTVASASVSPKAHAPKFVVRAVSVAPYGLILTTAAGYTLYGYHGDTKNTSTVPATVLAAWPPLIVPPGDVLTPERGLHYLGKFKLPNGQMQVTWHEKPLYTFVKDTTPDEVTGEGKFSNGFYVFQVALRK